MWRASYGKGPEMRGLIWEALEWGGVIWYGACNGGPGVVRNVSNPAHVLLDGLHLICGGDQVHFSER